MGAAGSTPPLRVVVAVLVRSDTIDQCGLPKDEGWGEEGNRTLFLQSGLEDGGRPTPPPTPPTATRKGGRRNPRLPHSPHRRGLTPTPPIRGPSTLPRPGPSLPRPGPSPPSQGPAMRWRDRASRPWAPTLAHTAGALARAPPQYHRQRTRPRTGRPLRKRGTLTVPWRARLRFSAARRSGGVFRGPLPSARRARDLLLPVPPPPRRDGISKATAAAASRPRAPPTPPTRPACRPLVVVRRRGPTERVSCGVGGARERVEQGTFCVT